MGERGAFRKVYVVSHTHWDREWYEDFQGFRTRLVYMLDELIETMEANPAYRHFLLDGQTIMVQDYLEIRPENRERLLALIRAGRIDVGPWYVMPDEFLVSGESLVRNLLLGFRQSRAMGVEPVKSGYVVDIFGHNSQLPQLLRGFGIDNAVMFRGLYGDAGPSELWWEGADGSRVLGLKLDEDRSYGDFYFFLRWPFADRGFAYDEEELKRRAKDMLAYKAQRATTELLLGLDGVDHIEIEPRLPWMLELLNGAKEELGGVEFVHARLEDYLGALRSEVGELRVLRGEQRAPGRNGMNNWVLTNVASSRVHLKQANRRGERLLERWAEPWGVFAAWEGRPYSAAFLAKAWEYLLQNHPHDSICGCSIDQVHRDMLYRFDQSRSIAERMLREQLLYVANHVDAASLHGGCVVVVFQPSPSPYDGVARIEFELPHDERGGLSVGGGAGNFLGGSFLTLRDADNREVPFQLVSVRKNSVRRVRPYRDIPGAETVDRVTIAFRAVLPPCGYAAYSVEKSVVPTPAAREYAPPVVQPKRLLGTQRAGAAAWDNGRLKVAVRGDGAIDITDRATGIVYEGLLRFEDEGDVGEGWNHIAPFVNQTYVSCGADLHVSAQEDGPLLTTVLIGQSFFVPASVEPDGVRRADALVRLSVRTYVELRRDDPVLRCRTVIDNAAKDHRLKALFPTGRKAESYAAGTPFDFVSRGVAKPDRSDYVEYPRPEEPHDGFLAVRDDAGGLAIFAKGLYEAEVRDDAARTVALTLFRSTGAEVLTDGGDGGQLLRELTFEYAIRPFEPQESLGRLAEERDRYECDLLSVSVKRAGEAAESLQLRARDLPLRRSYLSIDNPNVRLSAMKRAEERPDRDVLRVWNASEAPQTATIMFARPLKAATLLSLDERDAAPADGFRPGETALRLTLEPKRIATIGLEWTDGTIDGQ
ncbi:alpha-mannosidase [Paenibacillus sp.]|uniref:alpha-mannosidase n=1 Tax=Paenibacillus sp. TaxID=58172 RepID=UPI002D43D40D|nr:glycoside hydrolase family 38 C-terminal domain-containing protein [Paenibacillus sp.]HZG54990.1 glycoside hydrolase family 38 C-terminal domain-containing protein [Paenibacillus sp.]